MTNNMSLAWWELLHNFKNCRTLISVKCVIKCMRHESNLKRVSRQSYFIFSDKLLNLRSNNLVTNVLYFGSLISAQYEEDRSALSIGHLRLWPNDYLAFDHMWTTAFTQKMQLWHWFKMYQQSYSHYCFTIVAELLLHRRWQGLPRRWRPSWTAVPCLCLCPARRLAVLAGAAAVLQLARHSDIFGSGNIYGII